MAKRRLTEKQANESLFLNKFFFLSSLSSHNHDIKLCLSVFRIPIPQWTVSALNLSLQVKACLFYMTTFSVPLSCFWLHLVRFSCHDLIDFNLLVISFIQGEEKQKYCYLKKPSAFLCMTEFIRILLRENGTPPKIKK